MRVCFFFACFAPFVQCVQRPANVSFHSPRHCIRYHYIIAWNAAALFRVSQKSSIRPAIWKSGKLNECHRNDGHKKSHSQCNHNWKIQWRSFFSFESVLAPHQRWAGTKVAFILWAGEYANDWNVSFCYTFLPTLHYCLFIVVNLERLGAYLFVHFDIKAIWHLVVLERHNKL